jgi:hypothetical protein
VQVNLMIVRFQFGFFGNFRRSWQFRWPEVPMDRWTDPALPRW